MISPFLSTLSLRRATPPRTCPQFLTFYFYPRSPCGERPYSQHVTRPSEYFYPRSPCGERRKQAITAEQTARISIHALLAESDGIIDIINNVIDNFYPRSPCGERRQDKQICRAKISISIHALLAESDIAIVDNIIFVPGFLSTLSLRRATAG